MQHYGVNIDPGSGTVTFETYFSCHKSVWIAATDCLYVFLPSCTISTNNCISINK